MTDRYARAQARQQFERLKSAAVQAYEARSKPEAYREALAELERAALAYGSWSTQAK